MVVKPVTGLDQENKTTERETNLSTDKEKTSGKPPEVFSFRKSLPMILYIKKGKHLSLVYAY